MSSVAHSISGQSSQSEKKSLSHHESVINPAFRQRMEKLTAVREDTENERDSEYGKIPAPSHRHAGPSAPWPWVNIDDGTLPNTHDHSRIYLIIATHPCRSGRRNSQQLPSTRTPTMRPFLVQWPLLERIPSIALPELDCRAARTEQDQSRYSEHDKCDDQ